MDEPWRYSCFFGGLTMQRILEAPASGFVKVLLVPNHAIVERNMPVGSIDDETERLSMAQITILKRIALLTRLRLDGGRTARARATNFARRRAVTDLIDLRKEMLLESKDSFQVGQVRSEEITFSELALATA